jgi:hypothetical protein
MGVVVLGSVRSSGTTTLAVGLAATWPRDRRALVVEADPAGGTLAAACGWPPAPSLVSLAAAVRRHGDPETIWAHCHHLPGGASVLAAPAGADQARSAAGMAAPLLGRLGELDADVLIDLGRLDPTLAMPELAEQAGRVVLTARPALADLHALATFVEVRVSGDASLWERLGLVLVGDGPYPDAEIAGALELEVLGHLPFDPEAAGLCCVLPALDRRLRLSPLVRAARSLAEALADDLAPSPETALEAVRGDMPTRSARASRQDVAGASTPADATLRTRLRTRLRSRLGRARHTPVAATPTASSDGSGAGVDGAVGTSAVEGSAVEGSALGSWATRDGVVANGSCPGGGQVR